MVTSYSNEVLTMKHNFIKPIALSCAMLSTASAQAIDLGIYYTAAFKAHYGNNTESLRNAIAAEISVANSALQQAGSTYSYNIIYISESSIDKITATGAAGSLQTNSMSVSDAVNAGVDIQLVYYGSSSGNCGAETHNGPGNDRTLASMSWASISSGCMGEGTTAHELGHSHGMGHQDGEGGVTPYAKAMICDSTATLVHTGHSLNFYSDPSKDKNGEACGVDGEFDNARIAREFGPYVDNHRTLRREATVSLAASNYAANEEDGGVSITVNLTNPVTDAAYVEAYITNGTVNSADYIWEPKRISIPIGVTTFDFTIPVVNDDIPEAAEAFTIGLRDGVGVSANDTATVTIAESDVVEVVDGNVSFDNSEITITEGESATIGLTRTGSEGDAVISFSSENLSMLSDSELTFSPGQERNLTISIPQDNVAEGNRSFTVDLSHPTASVVGSIKTLTVNVIEDDSTGYIKIPDSAYNGTERWGVYYYVSEGDIVTLPLERADGSIGIVSSNVSVFQGDAASVSFSSEVMFEDGIDSGSLTVKIIDSDNLQGDREVVLYVETGEEGVGVFNGAVYLVITDSNDTDPTPTDPTPTDPTPTDPTPTDPTPTDPTPTDPAPTDPTPGITGEVSIKNAPTEVLEGAEFKVTLELSNATESEVKTVLWYLGESTEYKLNKSSSSVVVTLLAPLDSSTDDVVEKITLIGDNNNTIHTITIKDTDLEGSVQFSSDSYNIAVTETETFELTVERTEGENGIISVNLENLQGDYDDVELLIHDGQMTASHTYTTVENEGNNGNQELTFRLINSNTDIVNQDAVLVDVADNESIGTVTFKLDKKDVIENEEFPIEIVRTGGEAGVISFYLRENRDGKTTNKTITMSDGETSQVVLIYPIDADGADVTVMYTIVNKDSGKYGDLKGDITLLNVTVLDVDIGTVDEPFELTTEQNEGTSTIDNGSDALFTITRPERVFGDVEFTIFNTELGLEMFVTLPDGQDSIDVTFAIPAMNLDSDTKIDLSILGVDGTLAGTVAVTVKPLEDKVLDVQAESENVKQGETIAIVLNRPEALVGDVVFTVSIPMLAIEEDITLLAGVDVYVYEVLTTVESPESLTITFKEKSLAQYKGTVSVTVGSTVEPTTPKDSESGGGSMGFIALLLGGVLITRRKK